MEDTIDRDTYPNPFGGDDDIRVYTKGTTHMPSVTTVLATRDDDKSNLYAWQDRNDGEGDNAFHEYLFWYSRHIGTLGHWHALSTLDDSLEWTEDEAESAWVLNNVSKITDDSDYDAYSERLGRSFTVDGEDHPEIQTATPRDVLYSVLKQQHSVESWGEFFDEHSPYESHDYYSGQLLEQAASDIAFFRSGQQRLWSKLGVDEESVITVEQFLFNEEYKYAGQVDLVYEDQNGYIVVADLKSSSGCYDKHQIQGAAYGKAIEMADDIDVDAVDRLEVHRAHPRSGQLAAHTHSGADGQQPIHTTQYWNDGFDAQWENFKRLTDNFDDVDFTELTQD
jgi:hypothetical protein